MEQYINKAALVAWIKNRFLPTVNPNADMWEMGADAERVNILNFINTLEAIEVDLDKEIEEQCKKVNQLAVGKELRNICRYFFELGLKSTERRADDDTKRT